MIPILYPGDETEFMNNGIGALSDAEECKVTEILNGSYELELKTPFEGSFAKYILVNDIIKAKPNYIDEPQPFRIYSVEKNIDGLVNVKAAHLSYDTNGIPVLPFEAENLDAAIDNMNNNRKTYLPSPFEIVTDFQADGNLKISVPSSFRSILGDGENTILGVYGGDYHYDWYTIELLSRRGTERGICFRSGINLESFQQEINSEESYSAIVGFWKENDEDNPDYVYSDIFVFESNVPYEKTLILEVKNEDMGLSDNATPTAEQLNDYVDSYISSNDVGSFKYSMQITYAEDNQITRVNVGDTVGVSLPEYGIVSTARCSKVVFDSLLERNESIEIGSVDTGLAGEIAALSSGN